MDSLENQSTKAPYRLRFSSKIEEIIAKFAEAIGIRKVRNTLNHENKPLGLPQGKHIYTQVRFST